MRLTTFVSRRNDLYHGNYVVMAGVANDDGIGLGGATVFFQPNSEANFRRRDGQDHATAFW